MNQLKITKQESVGIDAFHNSKNKKVDLHFIAKNVPFAVILESNQKLTSEAVQISLVYENDLNKIVEGIQKESFAFIAHLIDSTHCSVEIRINALSSQHEGANFVLKFSIGSMEVDSSPIKVLSKRTQIEKHLHRVKTQVNQSITTTPSKRKASSYKYEEDENISETDMSVSNNNNSNSNISEDVVKLLRRLEKQQKEHKALLERISKDQKKNQQKKTISAAVVKKTKVEKRNNHTVPLKGPLDFQNAFTNLLDFWKQIPNVEKQSLMQTTLDTLKENEKETLSTFLYTVSHPSSFLPENTNNIPGLSPESENSPFSQLCPSSTPNHESSQQMNQIFNEFVKSNNFESQMFEEDALQSESSSPQQGENFNCNTGLKNESEKLFFDPSFSFYQENFESYHLRSSASDSLEPYF